MMELKTEHLFDAHFTVAASAQEWFAIGNGAWGTRVIVPAVSGGTFEGPKMKGILKPFGADWLLLRNDNVPWVDARIVLETDDGALIHMHYNGIVDWSEGEIKKIIEEGKITPGASVHTTPHFETGHEKYLWLNRIMAAGIGKIGSNADQLYVDYSIYALR